MSNRKHTVMVVDDEPEIVESLRRTLRNEPYTVLGTTSPFEAFEAVEAGGVDVLVADIDMPELNGLELVAKVRAVRPEVVRILLTGDASLDSALEAINRGEVYRYLTKPWRARELRDTVREALGRLDELRRAAAADRATRAREAMLSALEWEHPGIRTVTLVGGVHVLDVVRLRAILADARSLDPLFARGEPEAAFDPPKQGDTRR